MEELDKADHLLNDFVYEFEKLYGKESMVFNIHLLLHLSKCVEQNGPLHFYSNYNMEDNMGHMLRNVHGTNDVIQQTCQKYVMESELNHIISESRIAQTYHASVQAKHRFSVSKKIGSLYAIGSPIVPSAIINEEEAFIWNYFNLDEGNEELKQYHAVLLESGTYYESIVRKNKSKKHTNDHFVCDADRNIFGDIKTFIELNREIYVLICNAYKRRINPPNTCDSIVWLEKADDEYIILGREILEKKHVFLRQKTNIACIRYENLTKRN